MSFKKHIPNIITSGNLFCGCLAIVFAFESKLVYSAYFVGIAAILDFFDGFVARMLNVGGELGKQLDSLADMVTFGLVPGVVMYRLLSISLEVYLENNPGLVSDFIHLNLIAFLITIFSAMRLAKFNIDTRQSTSFIGIPTPANAMLICALPLILTFQPVVAAIRFDLLILNPIFLFSLTLIMSYLLVAELPLFALKFKNFTFADNKMQFIFLLISLAMLFLFHFIAIPLIIALYIILSIFNNLSIKNKTL